MASQARLAGMLSGAILSIVAVVVLRAAGIESQQVSPSGPPTPTDPLRAAALVSEAVTHPTVADGAHSDAFQAFGDWHRARFPLLHERLTRAEATPGHSMLFVWPGSQPELDPVLFLAHQDVVPVEEGTEADWAYPAFSGAIAPCSDAPGECVWGRGTIDMKTTLVALSDGVERLLDEGWQPTRSLYIWFSDDEEVGGASTQALNGMWARDDQRFAFALDEGLVVTDGLLPGMGAEVALVGLAEKGYLSLEITASGEMGHASMPPDRTAVGVLAQALTALEASPFPAELDGPAEAMFAHLAPEMGYPERLVFANLWLTRSLVMRQLQSGRATNALVRTTQAPTQLFASEAENVLPQEARAVVNFRLHPRDTMNGVLARVQSTVESGGGSVRVRVLSSSGNTDPSPVSTVDHPGYRAIAQAMRTQLPGVVVAPGLFIAATDSRHLLDRTDAVYRFSPTRMTPDDVGRAHGTDERVRVEDLGWAFAFYKDVLQSAGEWAPEHP